MVKYSLVFYKTALSSIVLPGQQLDTRKRRLKLRPFPWNLPGNGHFVFFWNRSWLHNKIYSYLLTNFDIAYFSLCCTYPSFYIAKALCVIGC